jgi:hypothetical protein
VNPPRAEPLDELTYCPGVVGDIIDWITDTLAVRTASWRSVLPWRSLAH